MNVKKKIVYVAGPYNHGNKGENIHNVIRVAEHLRKEGYLPFIPHLFHFWNTISFQEEEYWIAMDLDWLQHCDAFVQLPGISPGSDYERTICYSYDVPVYNSVEELLSDN